MVVIKCCGCKAVIFESSYPFTYLPSSCVCGCMDFYVVCVEDVELERLRSLERRGCLISTLLGE